MISAMWKLLNRTNGFIHKIELVVFHSFANLRIIVACLPSFVSLVFVEGFGVRFIFESDRAPIVILLPLTLSGDTDRTGLLEPTAIAPAAVGTRFEYIALFIDWRSF
jgi:hypothetical protein